jgi:tripartite-type tricarboxylate transporter receptor subunit TctC
MLVPKATSRAIIDILYRESARTLQMPEVQAKIRTLGADPMPMTSDQFEKLIADEIAMNKELVKRAGIAVN